MATSRRRFIVHGSLAGGGLIAAHLAGTSVFAQDEGRALRFVPRRRSLKGMAANDPVIEAWREGVGKLKAQNAVDPFKWTTLAAIHGTSTGFNKCPHGNWYFLPWHRAYLTMYERKVRELTNFPGFALPYWDWTNEPTLPPAFTAATVNGQPNPLFLQRSLSGALSATIVGQPIITQILGDSPFEVFGTTRPAGQNDLSQTWIARRTGAQGLLERTPHNLVHNNVGQVMQSTRSPIDPIFMMHHGNIDRLWAVWLAAGHANSTDPLWTDMPFTGHFFNNDGSVWSPKVSDLFVPEKLGYTYSLRRLPQLTGPAPTRWRGFERLFQLRPGETAEGVERSASTVRETASRTRALAVKVPVSAERLAPIMGRGFRGAGEDVLDIRSPQGDEPLIPRTVAIIRNLAVTNERDTEFRVFLNQAGLSASTPISAAGYVGTFGFFGGGHAGHGSDDKPSVLLDLTDAIGRVFPTGATPADLTVQIQPVARAGVAAAAVGTAAPESIEIAIVQP